MGQPGKNLTVAAIRFIWVGKLKEQFSIKAAEHYWKKLDRFHSLEETMLKDAPGKLPPTDKSLREGRAILEKVTPLDMAVVLDEKGRELTSRQLAAKLRFWTEDPNRRPCFIVGGPFGLSDEVRDRAHFSLSLSRLTLPHELARVMLLEQLYRAASINKGLPYHHD